MKIGIDGRALQRNRAGIGRYIFELCRELDKVLSDATFYLYSQIPVEMPVRTKRWVPRIDQFPYSKNMKSVAWLKFRCGCLCKTDNLDVFWASSTFLPKLPARNCG